MSPDSYSTLGFRVSGLGIPAFGIVPKERREA